MSRDHARRAQRSRWTGAAGQAVPIVAVLLLVAGLVGVGLVQVAAATSRRAAADATADAVALAGAAEGRDAADRVAAANDGRVVAYRVEGDDVVVTIERRGVQARARARWVPAVADP